QEEEVKKESTNKNAKGQGYGGEEDRFEESNIQAPSKKIKGTVGTKTPRTGQPALSSFNPKA
ncbi:MAG: hypothetical protein ACK53Y_18675, partial [bacterium]